MSSVFRVAFWPSSLTPASVASPAQVARVVGLSSSVLFDKANPLNPINRRISMIVMTKQAQEKATRTEEGQAGTMTEVPAPTASASPARTALPTASTAPPAQPSAASLAPGKKPSVQELAQALQAEVDAKR